MLMPMQPTVADSIAQIFRLVQASRGTEAETAARTLQRQFPARGDANETLRQVGHDLLARQCRATALDHATLVVDLVSCEETMAGRGPVLIERHSRRVDPHSAVWATETHWHEVLEFVVALR